MSISKVLCTALATVAVGTLFAADANSTLITFSSSGDKYADGSPVLDGEWYALCWSANETFGGLDADCNPIAEGDEVLRAISIAKGGVGCPRVVFVLDSTEAKTTGNYFVYMLDTRTSATAVATDADNNGRPDKVNSTTVAMTASSSSGVGNGGISTKGETGKTAVASASDVLIDEPAKIVSIDPNGNDVVITVANINPVLRYDIKYGKTIGAITTATTDRKGGFGGDGTVTFSISKENANFFQLKLAE